jgi:hypothetical protein
MDDLLEIAAQIPDGRVNLSKTDLHAALEQIMRNTACSNPLLSPLAIRSHIGAEIHGKNWISLAVDLVKSRKRRLPLQAIYFTRRRDGRATFLLRGRNVRIIGNPG